MLVMGRQAIRYVGGFKVQGLLTNCLRVPSPGVWFQRTGGDSV